MKGWWWKVIRRHQHCVLRSKILIIIVDEITTTTYYNTTAARCPMQYTRTMHLISQPFHVSNTNSEPAVEDGLAKSSQ